MNASCDQQHLGNCVNFRLNATDFVLDFNLPSQQNTLEEIKTQLIDAESLLRTYQSLQRQKLFSESTNQVKRTIGKLFRASIGLNLYDIGSHVTWRQTPSTTETFKTQDTTINHLSNLINHLEASYPHKDSHQLINRCKVIINIIKQILLESQKS